MTKDQVVLRLTEMIDQVRRNTSGEHSHTLVTIYLNVADAYMSARELVSRIDDPEPDAGELVTKLEALREDVVKAFPLMNPLDAHAANYAFGVREGLRRAVELINRELAKEKP